MVLFWHQVHKGTTFLCLLPPSWRSLGLLRPGWHRVEVSHSDVLPLPFICSGIDSVIPQKQHFCGYTKLTQLIFMMFLKALSNVCELAWSIGWAKIHWCELRSSFLTVAISSDSSDLAAKQNCSTCLGAILLCPRCQVHSVTVRINFIQANNHRIICNLSLMFQSHGTNSAMQMYSFSLIFSTFTIINANVFYWHFMIILYKDEN